MGSFFMAMAGSFVVSLLTACQDASDGSFNPSKLTFMFIGGSVLGWVLAAVVKLIVANFT